MKSNLLSHHQEKNMKKISILLILASVITVAQVPNGSFEEWTSDGPVNWASPNAPLLPQSVTKSTNAKTGNFAAKGTVVEWSPGMKIAPFIQSGDDASGFGFTNRPVKFTGSYTFDPVENDRFSVSVILMKEGNAVAIAARSFSGVTAVYRDFEIPFEYLSQETPDTCIVTVMIIGPDTGSDFHLGSSFTVDDLNFSDAPVSVEDESVNPNTFGLEQNYPNPFNPGTVIRYAMPSAGNVTLTVYNSLGEEVARLVDQFVEAGTHEVDFNAANLPSGLYLYKLNAGSFTSVKKMVLMK